MEVWLFGALGPEFMRYLPELQQAQEYAKSKATQQHASVTVNERQVQVGARGVTKAKGIHYFDFKLEWDGIELYVKSELAGDGGEVAYLTLSSFRLMRDGHSKCWTDAQQFADDLGLRINNSQVARIDLCVDLPGVPIELFCNAYQRRDFISRGKSGALYDEGLDYRGFTRGKDAVLIRVYDKLSEAQKKADDAKFDVLTQRRWDGEVPKHASRVEFQLRREWLASWNTVEADGMQGEARSVEQVFDLLPTISRYLVENWFRIVDDADRHREHGNQARAKASELWTRVCEAFATWVEGEVVQLVRRAATEPNAENALKQIKGLIAGVAAATPHKFKKPREVIDYVAQRVESLEGDGLLEKLLQRRSDLEANGRGRWYGVPLKPLIGHANQAFDEAIAPLAVDIEQLPF